MILLFLLGYALAEVIVAIALAAVFGWGPVIIAQFVGVVLGFALLRRAPVSGILIAVPGFITDAIGVILLIPGVRRLVARSAVIAVASRLGIELREEPGMAPPQGDVIRGEVIDRTEDGPG